MNQKLEKKLMKTVKKKILRKKLLERVQKGQILPVNAIASAGAIIAAGYAAVPLTAAFAGWKLYQHKKRRDAASEARSPRISESTEKQKKEPSPGEQAPGEERS